MGSHPFALIESVCLIEDLVFIANLNVLDTYVVVLAKEIHEDGQVKGVIGFRVAFAEGVENREPGR